MSFYGAPAQPTPHVPGGPKEAKPTLSGVRIKQRKGQAKATAKFDPEAFRDSLATFLSTLPTPPSPPPSQDLIISKYVLAGQSLELLKYSDQFFELFFCGGLLQPGGGFAPDGERVRVSVFGCTGRGVGVQEEGDEEGLKGGEDGGKGDWKKDVKDLVGVLIKVIQRYKYLQKPLDETCLAGLLAYLPRWTPLQREKMAYATALLILEGQVSGKCLQSLHKEGVVKDDVALDFITSFFKTYLASSNIDALSILLRKSGVSDLLLVFPSTVRDRSHLEKHFKKENLAVVWEWYLKKVAERQQVEVVAKLKEVLESGDESSVEEAIDFLKNQQAEFRTTDMDIVQWVWQAIMDEIDWSVKPEQVEGMAMKTISDFAPLLEPFCSTAKVQVGLINVVQVYCYSETRIIKTFPQILKVLYNDDCVSDQAIIYWAQKGAVAQGKQHFIKATEALVKYLEAQAEEEDDDDEEE